MKQNTSHPIFYTVLLFFGLVLLHYIFDKAGYSILGSFVAGDLLNTAPDASKIIKPKLAGMLFYKLCV